MSEWKMTKAEQKDLLRITSRRESLSILMESLMGISGGIQSAQEQWWLAVAKRLKIEPRPFPPLRADAIKGIITQEEKSK